MSSNSCEVKKYVLSAVVKSLVVVVVDFEVFESQMYICLYIRRLKKKNHQAIK